VVIDSIGGYRLIRKLGEGPRAQVFLAHPHREADDVIPAAIKIFHPGVSEESITLEAEALSRGAGPHSLELLDLTTGPGGVPALILTRCANGSVGRLIRERSDLRPGEAITILAPIALTLGRLHVSGATHGAIRPDSILFDQSRTPTLACFGNARLIDSGMPAAGRDAQPGLQSDLEAMRALATLVLEDVHDDAAANLVEWLNGCVPGESGWLEALVGHLFELAEPLAIDLRGDYASVAQAPPSRLMRTDPVPEAPTLRAPALLDLPDFVLRLIPDNLTVSGLLRNVRAVFSSVRPRFWVTAGIVTATLLVAIVAIPPSNSDAVPAPAASPVSLPGSPETAGLRETPRPSETLGPSDTDDPAAAAIFLLAQRQVCITELSLLCLDAVDHPDSAASIADQSLLGELQSGAEIPTAWAVAPSEVTVIERLGDSAIVRLGDPIGSEPVSLLLVRGELGWRIRSYLQR
jgi:eukaryotic-like serine/threonine-protein kinase